MFNINNLKIVLNNIDITESEDIINRTKLLKYFDNNELLLKYYEKEEEQILMGEFIDFLILCYNYREIKDYKEFKPYINLIEYCDQFSIFHNWTVYKILNNEFLKNYINEDNFYINTNYEIILKNYNFGIKYKGYEKPYSDFFEITEELDIKIYYKTINIKNIDVNYSIYIKKLITEIIEYITLTIVTKNNKINEYIKYLYFKSFTKNNIIKNEKLLLPIYDLLKEKSYDYRVINYLHLKHILTLFFELFEYQHYLEDNKLKKLILTNITREYKNEDCVHWEDFKDIFIINYDIIPDLRIYRYIILYINKLDKVFDEYIIQIENYNEINKLKKLEIIEYYKNKLIYKISGDKIIMKNKKIMNIRSLCIIIKNNEILLDKICELREKLLKNYHSQYIKELDEIINTINNFL